MPPPSTANPNRVLISPCIAAILLLAACAHPQNSPETFTPKIPSTQHLFDFSPATNGLAARIENANPDLSNPSVIFLRLQNTGNSPLAIPTANPQQAPSPFTLEAQINNRWTPIPWQSTLPPNSMDLTPRVCQYDHDPTLQPGESALIALEGDFPNRITNAAALRVAIHQPPSTTPTQWTGSLQTPPRNTYLPALPSQPLDLPTYLPPLSKVEFIGNAGTYQKLFTNGPMDESEYILLSRRIYPELNQLALYPPEAVRAAMEHDLAAEPNLHAQLVYAVEAAARGSTLARQFIEKQLASTSHPIVISTSDALVQLAESPHPPDWVWPAMFARLLDNRRATDIPSNWSSQTPITISYLADEDCYMALRLGQLHCQPAVPTLIQLVKSGDHIRNAITALGEIGDPAAIPALMQVLQSSENEVQIARGTLSPEKFAVAARALAQLHAKAALPILLRHLIHKEIAEDLETLGDPSAIPALKKLLANSASSPPNSEDETQSDLLFAAKLALITLEQKNPTPAYIHFMQDQSAGEFQRRDALWRLGQHPDPAAIPAILQAIRSDPTGAVVNDAIAILGDRYPYPQSIRGLIDCLNANFIGKQDWKRAYTPEMFQNHILQILKQLTARNFGANIPQWKTWERATLK